MIRYFAIASALVMTAILVMLAIGRTTTARHAVDSAKLASPGLPRHEGASRATAAPLSGDAPWALSALPGCFRQRFEASGSHALPRLRAQDDPEIGLPVLWHRIEHASLVTANCRVHVAIDSVSVIRGDTRLEVPPHTHVYVAGKDLVLDRFNDGGETLRAYRLVDGSTPAFRAP